MSHSPAKNMCINKLSIEEVSIEHFSSIKKQISEAYEVIEFNSHSITFSSLWVPPFRFINGLSQTFHLCKLTLTSEVEDRLASKSYHHNGLLDSKEVPFSLKNTLEEFIWPKST